MASWLKGVWKTSQLSPRCRFSHPRRLAIKLRLLLSIALLAIGFPSQLHAQTNSAAAYTFSTFAGYALSDSSDGFGPDARFQDPVGVAFDANGNLYLTDLLNATVRKMTAAGVVSTIAGLAGYLGIDDGLNSNARFWSPRAIAVDTNGNVFVGDLEFFVIKKISPIGTNWLVSTVAGQIGTQGYQDGFNGGRLNGPSGLAADSSGNIYLADAAVRKLSLVSNTWVLSTIANSSGYVLVQLPDFSYGTNFVAQFSGTATSIAIDTSGNLYVADQLNHTITQLSPNGTNWVVRTIAGLAGSPGSTDGPGSAARFKSPVGISVDHSGIVYVADGNQTIRRLALQGTNWNVTTLAGSTGTTGSIDGVGTNALFNGPFGLAVDPANNLFVADSNNNEIRKVTSAGAVSTIAGSTFTGAASVDGVGTSARFHNPAGVALDNTGTLYVSDFDNHTIRSITSAGIVSTVAGLAGNPGTLDNVGSNARFNFPDGIAVDGAGNLYVVQDGDGALRRITPAGVVSTIPSVMATDVTVDKLGTIFIVSNNTVQGISLVGTNWAVTNVATLPDILNAIAAASDGRLFVLSGNGQIQMLTFTGTNWAVQGIGSPVGYAYHIAVDSADNVYVAGLTDPFIKKLTRVGTNWLLNSIGGSLGGSHNYLGGYADGAGAAALFRIPYGIAADPAGNIYISDAVNQNIRKGVFTLFTPYYAAPYNQPAMNGSLNLTLLPSEANGQWRFPWELAWRNSGQTASNLVQGNYDIELRPRPGWLAIPSRLTLQVTAGGLTSITTNIYYPTLLPTNSNATAGSLTVNLGATPPSGAGWRFLGDSGAFFSSGFSTNLLPGTYLIEFAGPFSGRTTPANASVQVVAGQPTVISVAYLLASSPPLGVLLPEAVPLSNVTNPPFGFNGQLESDVGFGSGVAALSNVVLTAAHLVFNDQNLSYVSRCYWFFQEEAGVFMPEPQPARAFYLLTGYAAQRTNDLQSGLYAPDQSTPQSRNLDVAALYFLSPVAAGGYGGYLPSDSMPNSWLAGTGLKMLTGYPVDGSAFGDASIIAGKFYQTEPQPYSLAIATDPNVANQQVYTANWFLSYPGNSGGPLYVQFNGSYYPAAIYLGTLYSGIQAYASTVRAIDSDVVNLVATASADAGTGTNNTGGGVITILPGQVSASNPGYVQFQLAPPSAVQQGAAWRLQGDSSYSTAANYTRAVTSTNSFAVEFKPIAGWNLPPNQFLSLQPGLITVANAFYTVTNPVLFANKTIGIGITGTTGTVYRLERRASLSSGSWLPVNTNTIGPGINVLLPAPLTNGPSSFYRAVWLP